MISEANHYTLFLSLARKYGEINDVNQKWNSLLEFEKEIIKKLTNSHTIHV